MEKKAIIKHIINSCIKVKSRDEANGLLCEIFKYNLSELFCKEEFSLQEIELIDKVIAELNAGKPLAKILKRAYFYGFDFYVNEDVLTPRQDSEILVNLALDEIKNKQRSTQDLELLDLCTGSGCLGLSIKCMSKSVSVDLADISGKAIEISKINASNLKQKVNFIQTDLFANINKRYDIIISNPPYIKTSDLDGLEGEVKNFDPLIALDGKESGLYYYEQIEQNAKQFLKDDGVLICEFGFDQAEEIKKIFDKIFASVTIYKDYGGNDRVVVCKNLKKDN